MSAEKFLGHPVSHIYVYTSGLWFNATRHMYIMKMIRSIERLQLLNRSCRLCAKGTRAANVEN